MRQLFTGEIAEATACMTVIPPKIINYYHRQGQ